VTLEAPVHPPDTLLQRYTPNDLDAFTDGELARFLPGVSRADATERWNEVLPQLGWELLYRVEPELYERLIAGERIHPGIIEWLPNADVAVEVAAGTGRLTAALVERARRVVAIEPAAPLLARLRRICSPVAGFFDALPARDASADLVIACSAFTSDPAHGGEPGLAEMQRVCAPGGIVAIVWPQDASWLEARGFETISFPGEMAVEFASPDEAVELARIFYPHAAGEIDRRRLNHVPYDLLGFEAPRTVCWKRV
jgi:SAM-dependent methyltransferase